MVHDAQRTFLGFAPARPFELESVHFFVDRDEQARIRRT